MAGGHQLWFDSETFSMVTLKRGHHAYFDKAAKPQIMIATWALNDGPVQTEDLTEVERSGAVTTFMPSPELEHWLHEADEVVIHNSAFDRRAMAACWGIDLAVERVHDTMVQAMVHSLPGSLGKLCEIMGVDEDEAKAEGGGALIRLFCMPLPKNQKLRRATKVTHPEKWREFLSYAGQDITSMRALYDKLPIWNYRDTNEHQERSLWHLDQRINERGFRVDMDMTRAAIATVGREQKRLDAETRELTADRLDKATRRDDLLIEVFVEYGIYLPDLKKDTLERRLEDPEIPDALAQLLRVRLARTTTSTAKYTALTRVSVQEAADVHVIRGSLAFAGALRTARWGGRLFQPHNLPRPRPWFHHTEQLAAIEALKADCLDLVDADPMRTLGDLLRGVIIARPGHRLFSSDLANIESRIAAWLAGEQWKLDAFAEIDTAKREGRKDVPDMYQRAYAMMFAVVALLVAGDERQVGKVSELACAYEGGVGAWIAFAMVYRLDLDKLAEAAYPHLPSGARDNAEFMWDWRRKKGLTTFGLAKRTFVVFETFKTLWRKAHPRTSSYWGELNDAAIEAIRCPGDEIEARRLVFQKKGAWLRMILPSGRVLCYPAARVEMQRGKEVITYAGVNQYSRKWSRIHTYGGKLFENATQAVARDVMAHNMPAIEAAGWNILLTVHDDVIAEAPEKNGLGHFTTERLSAILAKNPPWLPGCPLAADGFDGDRYRKD